MDSILITESDMRVIIIRGIIKVVVKIIIGIGIIFLFLSYTLTFAQDILEKDYNTMPQSPNSLKGAGVPQGAVVREKSTKSPTEWEPGDPIHVPLFGGMEGTVRWRNKDTLVVLLANGKVAVGLYHEATGEYFWYCLDDWKVLANYELKRTRERIKEGHNEDKEKHNGFSGQVANGLIPKVETMVNGDRENAVLNQESFLGENTPSNENKELKD